MLAKRIIPVLLTRDGNLVKGEQYDSRRVVGNAQQAAEIHQARGVDELLVLDVAATPGNRGPDIDAMRRLTECCFIPVTVGGGVTEIWQVRELLANGADKVVIGTAAIHTPELIFQCANKFGSQAITVALDFRRSGRQWSAVINCGKTILDNLRSPADLAGHMEDMGAGELIITNVLRDGAMIGYDLGLISEIVQAVNIPVIASGGCGKYLHMHQALNVGADAVAAGAMFQWTDQTPKGAAEFLAKKGWEVRK